MISHKHKCIFVHIPKTAGMSINSFFHPGVKFHYANPDYTRLFGWCPKRKIHMQHATSSQLVETELITEEQWKSYYKFTFVRNPWDRAYSDYLWVQGFSGVKGNFKQYITKSGEFKKIFTNNSSDKYLGDHLISQTDFFDLQGHYELDFVGRFENFAADILQILISLKITEDFKIFQNRSDKRLNDYSKFYTNTNMKLVESKYRADIDKLGYKFEDKRTGLDWIKKLF